MSDLAPDVERMIRRSQRKFRKEVLPELRRRRSHTKPSVQRRLKHRQHLRRLHVEERKGG